MAFERGTAQTVAIICYDGETPTDPVTPVATVSTDGGAFAAADNAPAVIAGSGVVAITLSAAEMTGAVVVLRIASDNLEPQVQAYYAEAAYTGTRAERIDDLALEATLEAMQGAGWTDETLVTLQTAIDAVTGDGAYTITFTLSDGSGTLAAGLKTQIEDASGNLVAGPISTDSSGQVTYWLDDGTYYIVSPSTSVWQGNSEEVVVSASASVAVTLTAQTLPTPSSPDKYTVIVNARDEFADAVSAAEWSMVITDVVPRGLDASNLVQMTKRTALTVDANAQRSFEISTETEVVKLQVTPTLADGSSGAAEVYTCIVRAADADAEGRIYLSDMISD